MKNKKTILYFVNGVLFGILLTLVAGLIFLRFNLILQQESKYPFEETVRRFPQEALRSGKWIVRDIPCGLPEQNPGSRIAVFEICAREYSTQILSDPDACQMAVVLPCKIVIYEKDGKTWIARLNAKIFMRLTNETADTVFAEYILPEQQRMLFPLLK